MVRRRRIDWIASALGTLTLGLVLYAFSIDRGETVREAEETVFDQFQRWEPRVYDPEAPVRVIDIDEASLQRLGQWPWPRFYMAEMARRLSDAGAAAVAFDVLFSEPDRTSPAALAASYRRFGDFYGLSSGGTGAPGSAAPPDHDQIFAAVISQTPIVMGFHATDDPQELRLPPQPRGIPITGDGGDIRPAVQWYLGAIPNLKNLSDNALGVGTIALAKDFGTVIRRVPMVVAIGTNDWLYPSLSIEALRVAQGARSHVVKTSRGAGQADFSEQVSIVSIKVGGAIVPLDDDGQLRVRYSEIVDQRTIPAWQVMAEAGLPPEVAEEVAGRIVFVGSSADALFDIRRTPIHDRISGVHVHAEIVEQIVQGDFLSVPLWSVGVQRIVMVLCGLSVILLVALSLPLPAFTLMGTSLAGVAGSSWYAFSAHSLLVSPVAPALGILLPYLVVSGYKYFTSEANRREITRQFEHFVAPEVISDLIDNPDTLTPGGAERTLSILFLDVRRFSTITEKMEPQEVIAFINDLLTPLTDAILEHEGTIDKYIGDAVMAFWNAPRETPDHEIKAVRAMMEFNGILDRLNPVFTARGIPRIDIGVGVNTGTCSVGNMGSLKRLAYSCVGDSVNLAARLEGQTKAYGVRTLIGSATARAVADSFAVLELDSVAVKGRTQPETIFTVAGDADLAASPGFLELSGLLGNARAAYLRQDWAAAEAAFADAARLGPAGIFDPAVLCGAMIERISEYRAAPPPKDWDGVFIAKTK